MPLKSQAFIMNNDAAANHQRYLERVALFRSYGYDIEQEREAIFEQAQPIKGAILEVGTGKGHFAISLAQKGHQFISIDSSKDEQQFARLNLEYFNLLDQVDLRVADAGQTAFNDNSFDVIFAINMLHHLEYPYLVMHELTRVLKAPGKLIISDFSRKGMDLVNEIHHREGRRHPASNVSVNQVGVYLLERGFQIEKHRTVFQETIIARQGKAGPA